MGRISSAVTILTLLLAASAALGQDDTGSGDTESSASASSNREVPRPIEEITVVGQRSLARLRLRIDEKSNEIFSFFNEHNSNDRFDIICSRRRPTGSYILQRECEPKFLRDRRVQLTRDYMLGIGVPFSQRALIDQMAGDYELLQNEMLQLMAEHKEFSNDLADLAELTENYEAHRRAMFADD